jgi:hypothetical protein
VTDWLATPFFALVDFALDKPLSTVVTASMLAVVLVMLLR